MADADAVSTLLQGAGFDRISFERHDCDVCIGRDIDDAVDFAMSLGPAGEIIRLAGPTARSTSRRSSPRCAKSSSSFGNPVASGPPSSAWFVTASRPHP